MKIVNAKDYAEQQGYKTVKESVMKRCSEMALTGVLDTPMVDGDHAGEPVLAEINFGRWVARCECGGAEVVFIDEPFLYCFSCGNYSTKGKPRYVKFPSKSKAKKIEELLLKRPVIIKSGTNKLARIVQSIPTDRTLPRSWEPQESLEDLRNENKDIK